jgi:hypothetical protein
MPEPSNSSPVFLHSSNDGAFLFAPRFSQSGLFHAFSADLSREARSPPLAALLWRSSASGPPPNPAHIAAPSTRATPTIVPASLARPLGLLLLPTRFRRCTRHILFLLIADQRVRVCISRISPSPSPGRPLPLARARPVCEHLALYECRQWPYDVILVCPYRRVLQPPPNDSRLSLPFTRQLRPSPPRCDIHGNGDRKVRQPSSPPGLESRFTSVSGPRLCPRDKESLAGFTYARQPASDR